MKFQSKLSGQRGFSLVELLVVIAVIAIIAAIAIPNIANITSQATVSKDQRNAQNIASVASAARAAGYTNSWTSVANAVSVLSTNGGQGLTVVAGSGTLQFGISPIAETGYTNYLSISASGTPDQVLYDPN